MAGSVVTTLPVLLIFLARLQRYYLDGLLAGSVKEWHAGRSSCRCLRLIGAAPAAPVTLDGFDDAATWKVTASDGVGGTTSSVPGVHGNALRLDYDFTGGRATRSSADASTRPSRAISRLRFKLRGEGPANALEVKLTDANAENVWWHRFPDLVPPHEWTEFAIKRRQVEFAWGPTADRKLRRAAAIEFVVAAGKGGGKGWIALDDLTLERLPDDPAAPPPVTARGEGRRAVDGDFKSAQIGCAGAALDLDLGYAREFGGLGFTGAPDSPPTMQLPCPAMAKRGRTVPPG